jgi:hypothetical protein
MGVVNLEQAGGLILKRRLLFIIYVIRLTCLLFSKKSKVYYLIQKNHASRLYLICSLSLFQTK